MKILACLIKQSSAERASTRYVWYMPMNIAAHAIVSKFGGGVMLRSTKIRQRMFGTLKKSGGRRRILQKNCKGDTYVASMGTTFELCLKGYLHLATKLCRTMSRDRRHADRIASNLVARRSATGFQCSCKQTLRELVKRTRGYEC
jgi:hypothetical protein